MGPDLGSHREGVGVSAEIEAGEIVHGVHDRDAQLEQVLVLVEHVRLVQRERDPVGDVNERVKSKIDCFPSLDSFDANGVVIWSAL